MSKIKSQTERLVYHNYIIFWHKNSESYSIVCLEYMAPEIDKHFKTIKEAKKFIQTQPYFV